MLFATTVSTASGAEIETSDLGLGFLQPLTDEEGEAIRGAGQATYSSGFSFVSGFAYDPSTGSNMSVVSSQSSRSSDGSIGHGAYAGSQQAAGVNFILNIGGGSNFSASVFGIVRGAGLATSR